MKLLPLVAGVLASIVLGPTPVGPESILVVQNRTSQISTWEVGTGKTPLVLMHGYGSSAQEWVPFAQTILIAPERRFVFPEGPETTTPPDGPMQGRAWWRLELASYRGPTRRGSEGHEQGQGPPDLSRSRPDGLGRAATRVQALLVDLHERLGYRQDQLILGGFSQGAMVAAELAFRSREPLRALVLLSGTPVDEPSWLQGIRFRRGLPVFIAHGRQDDVLPFRGSARLQQTMRDAGLQVTWVPFEGGHVTPAEIVTALNQFLADVDKDILGSKPQSR